MYIPSEENPNFDRWREKGNENIFRPFIRNAREMRKGWNVLLYLPENVYKVFFLSAEPWQGEHAYYTPTSFSLLILVLPAHSSSQLQ